MNSLELRPTNDDPDEASDAGVSPSSTFTSSLASNFSLMSLIPVDSLRNSNSPSH
ncbi:hypothetical protein Hanom_Chr15g01366841 [Helianthus anomalus]